MGVVKRVLSIPNTPQIPGTIEDLILFKFIEQQTYSLHLQPGDSLQFRNFKILITCNPLLSDALSCHRRMNRFLQQTSGENCRQLPGLKTLAEDLSCKLDGHLSICGGLDRT